MNPNDCISAINRAIEDEKLPKMSKADVAAIVEEMRTIRSRIFERGADVTGAEFRQKAMDLINERRFKQSALRKEAAENLLKIQKNLAFINQPAFKDEPWEAIKALFGQTNRIAVDGNNSIYHMEKGLLAQWLNTLDLRLRDAGLQEFVKSGVLDRQIMQELYEFREGGKPGISKSAEALQAAKIIKGAQRWMVETLQKSGSSIRELDGYITRQVHDRAKIMAAGEDAWMLNVASKLDLDKTFGPLSKREILQELQETYRDIVAGRFGSNLTDGVSDQFITVNGASPNLAKKNARSRSLHFKDADAFFEYNQQFGNKNLLESVIKGAEKAARDSALMYHLGTNPEAALNGLIARAKRQVADRPEILTQLEDQEPSIKRLFATAQGISDTPGTSIAARAGRSARAIQSVSKMGGAFISSFSDLPVAAATLRGANGKSLFENSFSLIGDYLSQFTSSSERAKWAQRLSVYMDDVRGEMLSRYGAEGAQPGVMSKLVRANNKLTLMEAHTEASKLATAKQVAMVLADHAGTEHAHLPESMRATLDRYGISETSWKALSRAVEDVDGHKVMTPEALRAVPEDFFPGGAREKFDTEVSLVSMMNDFADIGSSTQGIRTKAKLLQGTKDEGLGVFLRLIGQFKGIMLTTWDSTQRIALSNPKTRPTGMRDAVLRGQGDMSGFAQFLIGMTAMGYFSMTAKDAALGKTPKSPTDPKVIAESFVRSGTMGLYGDFLMGEFNRRWGRSAIEAAAGPTLGAANDLVTSWSEAWRGEGKVGDTLKVLMQQVPFQNLFYTKGALDYLFLNRLNEKLNPGYLRRLEQKTKENPGLLDPHQQYNFYRPTESPRLFE